MYTVHRKHTVLDYESVLLRVHIYEYKPQNFNGREMSQIFPGDKRGIYDELHLSYYEQLKIIR